MGGPVAMMYENSILYKSREFEKKTREEDLPGARWGRELGRSPCHGLSAFNGCMITFCCSQELVSQPNQPVAKWRRD